MTKLAIVTGATNGIGKEIARGLASSGVTVVIGARDLELDRLCTAMTGVSA